MLRQSAAASVFKGRPLTKLSTPSSHKFDLPDHALHEMHCCSASSKSSQCWKAMSWRITQNKITRKQLSLTMSAQMLFLATLVILSSSMQSHAVQYTVTNNAGNTTGGVRFSRRLAFRSRKTMTGNYLFPKCS
ncbi:hypothetical protein NL676_038877 [Syzygium grande]|nr:hypothetical protein NL676_038877 [Syzygium grande]